MSFHRHQSPSVAQLLSGAMRWGVLYTFVFFITFPWWSGPALAVLRFVLEGLNSFGSGR